MLDRIGRKDSISKPPQPPAGRYPQVACRVFYDGIDEAFRQALGGGIAGEDPVLVPG